MDIINIKELPGRDYLHKVQKFARKAIDYINNNPDSFGYQFKFDKDSFNKVGLDPRDFYNDLVDALSLEGEYGISSTTNAPGPNPSFFDYEYNISLSESLDRTEDYTLKESYDDDYRIASVDEMIDGMSSNASDEVIDTTLRILKTISKKLKTPQDDMKVIITDRYTEHDVEGTDIGDNSYIGDIPHSGKYSTLKHYVTPNYEFIREYVRPADRVFIYFKNEDDLNSYLQDVEDYYVEDNLKEDMKKTPLARKLDDLKDKAKKIQQILEDDAIWADVYPMNDCVEVYIHMGDWKHEHLAAKNLIRDAFGDEIESIESDEEDNGQDTYDAYHKIYFKEPSLEEEYEEDKPFTYKEVYDELKRETYNFKDESGYCYYGFRSEASYAVEILSKHYEQVDMEDTTDPLLPNQKVFKVTYGPTPLEEGTKAGKRSMSDIKLDEAFEVKSSLDEAKNLIKNILKSLRVKKDKVDIILDKVGKDIHHDGVYEAFLGKLSLGDAQQVLKALDNNDDIYSINFGPGYVKFVFKKDFEKNPFEHTESLKEKLIQSDSDKALQKNIETEIRAGKDPKQAAAIAYSVRDKNKKKVNEEYDDSFTDDKLIVIKKMAQEDYKDNNILDLYHDFEEFQNRMEAKGFNVDEYDFDLYFDFIKEIDFNRDYYSDDLLDEGIGDTIKKVTDKIGDKVQKGSYLFNTSVANKNEFNAQKAKEKQDKANELKAKAQQDYKKASSQKGAYTTQLKKQATQLKKDQEAGKSSTLQDTAKRQGTLDKYQKSVHDQEKSKKQVTKAQAQADKAQKKVNKANAKEQQKIDKIDKGWQDFLNKKGIVIESLNKRDMDDLLKIAGEIGLKTIGDMKRFAERELGEGEDLLTALKRYRQELGDDFQIKESVKKN